MRRRGGYIAIEGPIGVGKTSLAHALGLRLGARIVLEDTDSNPFLARFYQDSEKYAFPVQLYFLLTRYNQQRQLAQQDLFAQATVSDYLLAKDRIFARLNLSPDELALYEGVYRLLDERIAKPDLVVYIRAGVEVLAERLRKRNRSFERHISMEYLERVSAAYRDFFFYYDETPLLVVDTSEIDFVAEPGDLDDLMREIDRTGAGTQYYVPRKR
ncbi:MAG TPA: deoxynucleoside kinase [Candidatus Binataceae bacterium]|jgi:deoxyadenosine/deoxycytidine kinase|nr:deoxynucleoside kinase [Candidatus Binataceae bacterium]